MISQGDWPLVGVYPHMSPHRRIGFTARRPAGNMMMPDRCQTPEVPILQTSKCPLPAHASTPAIASYAGKRTVKCGKNVADRGMKLVTSRRSTDPRIYRARRMPRLEIRPSREGPAGVFLICTKGGRGGAGPDRTRTQTIPEISGWRTRPNFLAKFFGKKFWK